MQNWKNYSILIFTSAFFLLFEYVDNKASVSTWKKVVLIHVDILDLNDSYCSQPIY